ncbi:hypothetical protein A3L04_02815 [Thermococcus chitonophagus]|uniref:Uncharacterized protein n=1 Tax=Thermococcus chitonophagus TaxID=54262 RepID=A0A160VQY4_9EURY|nr:hypothetical protein [Thermococcus chitonophagus]ASJ16084.1 hypothetical protein A3L04_02815 [Thermococcus chitonophagus]CUX77333.1 hypothetical protein CHITON_0554 [Thermococcus chitonophagus]
MKLIPGIAYLQVQRQAYVGYSMALAGWIGEYILAYERFPKPNFIRRALNKLGFSFSSEEDDERYFTMFYTKGNTGVTASWDIEEDRLFIQIFPLRGRIGKGITVRAERIELYDQEVVSIEPAQKLPRGIRSLGINPLIIEDKVPLSVPYWGSLYEEWQEDLKLLVMVDEIFDRLYREEYRCPICFSPLREEKGVLVCDRCGFKFTPVNEFERVVEELTAEEFSF